MRAWPVARSIFDAPLAPFDAPYVREANEGTTSWISARRPRYGRLFFLQAREKGDLGLRPSAFRRRAQHLRCSLSSLRCSLCERSERGDNKLDKCAAPTLWSALFPAGARKRGPWPSAFRRRALYLPCVSRAVVRRCLARAAAIECENGPQRQASHARMACHAQHLVG